MIDFPASHQDLLQTDVAILATLGPDGFPQVSALWFIVQDGVVTLSLNTARQKVKNLRAHPECTLFLLDPSNLYHTLEIRACAEIRPDPDYVVADAVGRKYNADLREHDRAGGERVVVTLRPVKSNTWG